MAKNTREGNRERAARRRSELGRRGVEQFQVIAPPAAKPLIREAARLMIRKDDPLEPQAALRWAGGANNELGSGESPPAVVAELESSRARIAEIEREATAAERLRRELAAERDAARAAEVIEREKVAAITLEAQEAQKRVTEALQRAEKAETAIRQAKALPGIKGRLVRWLVGDVLE